MRIAKKLGDVKIQVNLVNKKQIAVKQIYINKVELCLENCQHKC